MVEKFICDPDNTPNKYAKSVIIDLYQSYPILSFAVEYDTSCGSDQKHKGVDFYIFDMETAEQLDFLKQTVNVEAVKNIIISRILSNIPEGTEENQDCQYTAETLDYSDLKFHLFKNNVIVETSTPGCELTARINCSVFNQYFAEYSPLSNYCSS